MRGGADSRRRRILAGALGAALLPRLVLAQAQRDAAKNREITRPRAPPTVSAVNRSPWSIYIVVAARRRATSAAMSMRSGTQR